MLASMSYTVKSDRYVSQMIGLEPCLLPRPDAYYDGEFDNSEYLLFSAAADLYDMWSLFGPNWEDQKQTVCNILGQNSSECIGISGLEVAGDDLLTSPNPFAAGEVGVKHVKHLGQNYLYGQFQEYTSLWPVVQNTRNYYLYNMSDKIPVHGIFSN